MFGGIGLLFGVTGTMILLYLSGVWVFTDHAIGGRPLLQLGVLLEITAVQLISMGLVAELILHRSAHDFTLMSPIADRLDGVASSSSSVAEGD
jgi:dolichol-phosphate mannosyltransferase